MGDVELSCVESEVRKDWATYELYWGELLPGPGSRVFEVGLAHASSLMTDGNVLNLLGSRLMFEVAVGHNGRVWVKCESPREAALVVNAVKNAERMTPPQ